MKIEDVEVGMKVKLVSTFHTDDELGYCENLMLSVGGIAEVIYVDDDNNVKLSDYYWYSVKDLETYKEPNQNSENTNIGSLTVSISLEDKQEIAKDILKIVLNDFNKVISDAILSDQKITEIVEQALKEAFKESFLNRLTYLNTSLNK